MRLYAQLQAVQRGKADSSPGEENYIRNAKAMMKAIPFRLATKGLPKRFDKWEDSAMELRADEMLEIDLAAMLGQEGQHIENLAARAVQDARKDAKSTQRKRQDGHPTNCQTD